MPIFSDGSNIHKSLNFFHSHGDYCFSLLGIRPHRQRTQHRPPPLRAPGRRQGAGQQPVQHARPPLLHEQHRRHAHPTHRGPGFRGHGVGQHFEIGGFYFVATWEIVRKIILQVCFIITLENSRFSDERSFSIMLTTIPGKQLAFS